MKLTSVLLGIVLILAGIISFANPLFSVMSLGKIIGIVILLTGIGMMVGAYQTRKTIGSYIPGAITVIGGMVVLFTSLGSLTVVDILVTVIAVFALIGGITQIILSVSVRNTVKNWWIPLLTGIINTVVAVIVLLSPVTGLLTAGLLFAFEIIMTGIVMITIGCSGKTGIHVEFVE